MSEFIYTDPVKNTPGKPALLRYRACIELGIINPFTGIQAVGMFPDGSKFGTLILSTRNMLEDVDIDLEEIARYYIEDMRPEDIIGN
jgi:hypothetical protein